LYWAQLGRLVYGAKEEKRGFERLGKSLLHPKTQVLGGVLAEDAESMLKTFFSMRR